MANKWLKKCVVYKWLKKKCTYGTYVVPMVGRLVGYNFLARKTSRVSEISETVVCTVKYCTVDSITNTNLSISIRPMSRVERSGYCGGSPIRIRCPTYAWGLFRLESSILYLPRLWCKILARKTSSSEDRARVYRFEHERSNHLHLSC